jgi:hypothetical protein
VKESTWDLPGPDAAIPYFSVSDSLFAKQKLQGLPGKVVEIKGLRE